MYIEVMGENKILTMFVIGLLIGMAIGGYRAKYEGMTAKEWFYYYDNADANLIEYKECIESYTFVQEAISYCR